MCKRRRSSYTIEFKISVVEALRESKKQNVSKTAIKFGVDRKRVREWNNAYQKFKSIKQNLQKTRKKVEFVRQVKSREIENGVLMYLKSQLATCRKVKNKDLQQKALEIANFHGLTTFKASNMWLYRWKKRNQVISRRFTLGSTGSCSEEEDDEDLIIDVENDD